MNLKHTYIIYIYISIIYLNIYVECISIDSIALVRDIVYIYMYTNHNFSVQPDALWGFTRRSGRVYQGRGSPSGGPRNRSV